MDETWTDLRDAPAYPRAPDTSDRDWDIYRRYRDGESRAAIARTVGLCRQRVWGITYEVYSSARRTARKGD